MNKTDINLLHCFTSDDLAKYPGLLRKNRDKNVLAFRTDVAQFGIVSSPVTEDYSVDSLNL
jgi:hypothetical protein